jgi:hypothetical protein
MSLDDVQVMEGVTRIDYVIDIGERTFAMSCDSLGCPPFPWAQPDSILNHVALPAVTLPSGLRPVPGLQLSQGDLFVRALYATPPRLAHLFTEALSHMAVFAYRLEDDDLTAQIEAELLRRLRDFDLELAEFARLRPLQAALALPVRQRDQGRAPAGAQRRSRPRRPGRRLRGPGHNTLVALLYVLRLVGPGPDAARDKPGVRRCRRRRRRPGRRHWPRRRLYSGPGPDSLSRPVTQSHPGCAHNPGRDHGLPDGRPRQAQPD